MKVEIIDGNRVKEENIKEVMRHLKRQDASFPSTIKEYMETVADRMRLLNHNISTKNPRDFLEDLEEAGLIRLIKE